MQREMRHLVDLLENESAMRVEAARSMAAELGRCWAATRFDHFTTVEDAMPKRSAIARQLSPPAIAAATRVRRSSEYGLAMHAGPLPPACTLNQN